MICPSVDLSFESGKLRLGQGAADNAIAPLCEAFPKVLMTDQTGSAWLASNVAYSGDDCLDWPFSWRSEGYGRLEVGGRRVRAHRYMCQLAHGAPPSPDHQAAHSCGRRICINPRHLRWATAQENSDDKMAMNPLALTGSKHPRSRLTEQDVADIRAAICHGSTQKEIAREFGVHPSTISLAASGKNWAHV